MYTTTCSYFYNEKDDTVHNDLGTAETRDRNNNNIQVYLRICYDRARWIPTGGWVCVCVWEGGGVCFSTRFLCSFDLSLVENLKKNNIVLPSSLLKLQCNTNDVTQVLAKHHRISFRRGGSVIDHRIMPAINIIQPIKYNTIYMMCHFKRLWLCAVRPDGDTW